MNFKLLKSLTNPPKLYDKGTAVMWTDPYISKQLLEFHINPEIDVASRSAMKVEIITKWILEQTLKPEMTILDLGCGPGLYTEVLAKKGHKVTGVDFSENSIQYAINHANEQQLDIEYFHQNYLDINFEEQFDLIILIYLDFCALIPSERDQVLKNIFKALKKGGIFIFDVANSKNLDKKTIRPAWEVEESGFWKEEPYLALTKGYHFPEAQVLANQHIVIGKDDHIDSYIFWTHYFEKKDLLPMLQSIGFEAINNYEKVLPEGDCWNGENVTFYSAKKL